MLWAGPVQLEVVLHASAHVLWVQKSRKDTGNELKAPEAETEERILVCRV